jgi:hypothetical protein
MAAAMRSKATRFTTATLISTAITGALRLRLQEVTAAFEAIAHRDDPLLRQPGPGPGGGLMPRPGGPQLNPLGLLLSPRGRGRGPVLAPLAVLQAAATHEAFPCVASPVWAEAFAVVEVGGHAAEAVTPVAGAVNRAPTIDESLPS